MASQALIRAGYQAALSNPYARAGYIAGQWGPTMARAAYKIARWGVKRYRTRRRAPMRRAKRRKISASVGKRARLKFADRVGTSNAKKVAFNQDSTARDTRTLYATNLISIARGQSLNERERDIINFRGVRICNNFYNNGTAPLFLNVAVVSRKDADSTIPPDTDDFFRSLDSDTRGQAFNNSLSAIAFRCLPINTDKYLVHKHKRYTLQGDANGSGWLHSGPSYKTMKWYIPFKRQIRYDSDKGGSFSYNANLYLVWWCDAMYAQVSSAPVTSALNHQFHYVSYFRDTRN